MDNNHKKLYKEVEYYRLAFSYRDIVKECNFIERTFSKYRNSEFKTCIELASGPAEHSFYFSKKKETSILDLSSDMIDYVNTKDTNKKICKYNNDMSSFEINNSFDLAFMMLDSFSYLLTDDDICSHFNSVANILNEKGLYIIEMDHPGSYLENNNSLDNKKDIGIKWKIEKENYTVEMHWGSEGTKFNSATQIAEVKTILKVYNHRSNEYTIINDGAFQRIFTANEFKLHVKLSERFIILAQYRLFDLEKSFNNNLDGERMISVLQKIR